MKNFFTIIALFTILLSNAQTEKLVNQAAKSYSDTKSAVSTIHQDARDVVTTVHDDLTKIAPKVEEAVTSIAKGLKVGALSVWTILVQQQKVWSIGFLILTISSLLNWTWFYKLWLRKPDNKNTEYTILERDIIGDVINPQYDEYYAKRDNYKDDIRSQTHIKGPIGKEQYNAPKIIEKDHTGWDVFVAIIHLCITLTLSYLSITHFADMLTGFLNPEFGALKTIVEFTNTLK